MGGHKANDGARGVPQRQEAISGWRQCDLRRPDNGVKWEYPWLIHGVSMEYLWLIYGARMGLPDFEDRVL